MIRGAVIAQALVDMSATSFFEFTATRIQAGTIREAGNRWLTDHERGHLRLQVFRVNPYSGNTHRQTTWRARICPKQATHNAA